MPRIDPLHTRLGFALLALVPFAAMRCAPLAAPQNPALVTVAIGRTEFRLEVAADELTRHRGLGGRSQVAPATGMIFVFPESASLGFTMRDVPFPLDLLYLDEQARIVSIHTMPPEPPRAESEGRDTPEGDAAYDARLRLYMSDAPARFAIEIPGGSIAELGLRPGDTVRIPVQSLARRAR